MRLYGHRSYQCTVARNPAITVLVMSTTEVELSIHAIIKGYHLCRFKVTVGKQFTGYKEKEVFVTFLLLVIANTS